MKKKSLLYNLVIASLILTGCTTQSATSTNTPELNTKPYSNTELTIAAAADLTLAFKEIGESFEKYTGAKITLTLGSTGMIAQQIENGAPYDLFAAADEKVIDDLIKKDKLLPGSKELYALGRIGIATSIKSPLEVKDMNTLLNTKIKKIAIANPAHAPYGLASKQALETAGLWDQLKDKMVYGRNIQDTLTLITTGNADAGFIALSLVNNADVKFSLLEDKLHEPLRQAFGITKGTKKEELAKEFIKYVNKGEGRAIMKKYGFVLPEDGK